MAGRILIADDVATNRIILKVKLAASRYEVFQADDVASMLVMAHAQMPDLIIVTQSLAGGGVKAACDQLAMDANLANIPVIAILPTSDRRDRLAVLQDGADDLLVRPVDEDVLLALIRSQIRSRAIDGELQRKQVIAREFGFAETGEKFSRQARIALIPQNREAGFSWRAGLVGRLKDKVKVINKAQALDRFPDNQTPDVFVISACLTEGSDGLHLISELRSRPAKRHAVLVVHNPTGDEKITTLALDMGANSVLSGDFDSHELALRLQKLAPRKLQTDALRRALDQQLSMAMTDPLTGLYNRRYAQSYLARIVQSARRRHLPFTLMVLDLDRFKRVNDQYGHNVGDEVLVEVAKRLQANMRECDLLARLGGEEFLIALPDTNREDAARAAERLRRVVADRPIRSPSRGIDVAQTLSIGVFVSAENRDSPDRIEQMIDRADRALYASKADGRNQITFVRSAA